MDLLDENYEILAIEIKQLVEGMTYKIKKRDSTWDTMHKDQLTDNLAADLRLVLRNIEIMRYIAAVKKINN